MEIIFGTNTYFEVLRIFISKLIFSGKSQTDQKAIKKSGDMLLVFFALAHKQKNKSPKKGNPANQRANKHSNKVNEINSFSLKVSGLIFSKFPQNKTEPKKFNKGMQYKSATQGCLTIAHLPGSSFFTTWVMHSTIVANIKKGQPKLPQYLYKYPA